MYEETPASRGGQGVRVVEVLHINAYFGNLAMQQHTDFYFYRYLA
jgi:hypothetical protein